MKNRILIALLFVSTVLMAQKKPSFDEATAKTKVITIKYFNDYLKLDFEVLKSQMDNDISFNDTTAKLILGVGLVEGKVKVFENFKKTYASIVEMKSEPIRTMFSSNVGVFEIELTYKFKISADKTITISKMPLIVILTVKDGKVIKHRDYGDYNYFLKQYKAQLSQ
mgnify:CR=1 FL=1